MAWAANTLHTHFSDPVSKYEAAHLICTIDFKTLDRKMYLTCKEGVVELKFKKKLNLYSFLKHSFELPSGKHTTLEAHIGVSQTTLRRHSNGYQALLNIREYNAVMADAAQHLPEPTVAQLGAFGTVTAATAAVDVWTRAVQV
jgi:hypothetical protein